MDVIAPLIGKLLEYGIGGIAIAYLIYNLIDAKKELAKRDEHIHKMYEDRISTSMEVVKTIASNTVTNEKLAAACSAIADKFVTMSGKLEQLERAVDDMERRRS